MSNHHPLLFPKNEKQKPNKNKPPADRKDKKETKILAFCLGVDFPFLKKAGGGGWKFTHNPFSLPKPEFINDHLAGQNIEKILTTQYDIVMNGYEIGGGSIRAHTPELL